MSLAAPATGLLAYTGVDATDAKVVTVGTITYTLKTGVLSAAGHVKIEAGNPDATARNLSGAINGLTGAGWYAIPANAAAKASLDAVNDVVRIDARHPGTAGNSIALTTNEAQFTTPGTLSGGIDGTSLVPWSLVSLDEAKIALRIRGDSQDEEIVEILAEVADIIEGELFYRPVADIGDTLPEEDTDEYHDLANPQGFLYTLRRPIRTITSVYLAGALIGSSDYVIDRMAGMVTLMGAKTTPPSGSRLGSSPLYLGSGPFVNFPEDIWRFGSRYFPATQSSARILYKGGYAQTETVPPMLKGIALDVAARIYRTRERKSQGVVAEIAQGFQLATKYDMKTLNEDLLMRLRVYATLTKTARM
jgi:hypothetical protein